MAYFNLQISEEIFLHFLRVCHSDEKIDERKGYELVVRPRSRTETIAQFAMVKLTRLHQTLKDAQRVYTMYVSKKNLLARSVKVTEREDVRRRVSNMYC